MERRHWRAGAVAAVAAIAVVLAGPVPASAAIDHEAAIIDLQLDGFVPAPADIVPSGPMDENADPVPPAWTPAPGSPYVGGYMKSWMSMQTGHVVLIGAGEFTSAEAATLSSNQIERVGDGFPVTEQLDLEVPGIPGAVGVTATGDEGGTSLTLHMVAFPKGAIAYVVALAGPAGEVDAATAISVATQQYQFGPSVEPVPGVVDRDSAAYRLGQTVGKVMLIGVLVLLLGVAGLVVFLTARKKKGPQMAAAPAGWSMRPPPPPGYRPEPPPYDSFIPGAPAEPAPIPSPLPRPRPRRLSRPRRPHGRTRTPHPPTRPRRRPPLLPPRPQSCRARVHPAVRTSVRPRRARTAVLPGRRASPAAPRSGPARSPAANTPELDWRQTPSPRLRLLPQVRLR